MMWWEWSSSGEVVAAPPRMVVLAALVGQPAQRRLFTDGGVTAAQVADFVVALVFDGLRPREPIDQVARMKLSEACGVGTRERKESGNTARRV